MNDLAHYPSPVLVCRHFCPLSLQCNTRRSSCRNMHRGQPPKAVLDCADAVAVCGVNPMSHSRWGLGLMLMVDGGQILGTCGGSEEMIDQFVEWHGRTLGTIARFSCWWPSEGAARPVSHVSACFNLAVIPSTPRLVPIVYLLCVLDISE